MEAFLQKIAERVTKENLPYLYTRCYIFPTKRAAVYFNKYLENKFKSESFILPETLTIQEFITNFSTICIKEEWYLLLTLHQIQNELTQSNQPFEKFLPWGKLILKDFDECDKYLVDVKHLFSVLKSQKEMDESFSISDETRKYIEQFILTTSSKEKSAIYKESFIKTWSLLGEIYITFQYKLLQSNFGYEGMAYRDVYENLNDGSLRLPFDKITFCGFNALSICEEKIFKTIEQNYDAEFWWDADEHFLNNKHHEAGNFLREYQQKFTGKNQHWITDKMLGQDKKIDIIGISSDIGQTDYVAQHLIQNENETTAIILCNEHLLQPLLYSLDTGNCNITMGYSISNSELYLYTIALLNIYCHARTTHKQTDFYHKELQILAKHSYVFIKEKERFNNILSYFIPFVPKEIAEEYFPKDFFSPADDSLTILSVIIHHVQTVQKNDAYFYPVKEKILDKLNYLLKTFSENSINIDKKALPYIVKQYLSVEKVPFDTNTESNIQIMGFLESRIMDFDNLFILSLNDDNLPGTNKTNSFIPYNLRKGFGLPTFEQFDGINAYHFYRLLKRAKNIHLIYNNQIGDNTSEKSRFIRQIEHELNTQQNEMKIIISTLEDNKPDVYDTSILHKIFKTDVILAELRQRKYSPSALKIYLQCPLQFYLKYIAAVTEPEDLDEEIDAAVFGQILHKVLELIYHPHLLKVLNRPFILKLSDPEFIRSIIKQSCIELKLPKEILSGSNKLQLKIIERIAQKIIENDASEANLCVLKTEDKIIWDKLLLENGSFATIQGTIDRIDKINEQGIRIIDYKTGHIELPAFPDMNNKVSIEVFLDSLFVYKQKDYSATFQGLLYGLMYYKIHHSNEIFIGYHHAKNMKSGIAYLNNQQPVPLELLLCFEKRLSQLVSNIVYKETHFIQSENSTAYQYSVYADMLGIA